MRKILLLVISIGVFLVPNLLWGNLYIVGGDDARLYYLYPWEHLRHLSFNIISDNAMGSNLGYFAMSYWVPVISLLALLKHILPALNLQFFSYGFILSSGFYFFYKFLRELLPKENPWQFVCAVFASLLYIFSPYVFKTLFQSQLIAVFIVAVIPAFLYLFVRGLKEKRMELVVGSTLVYSFFSSTFFSFPWFLAFGFTLLPFLVYLFHLHKGYFLKSAVVFVLITFVCNFYWIIHLLISFLGGSAQAAINSSVMTAEAIQQNKDMISSLVFLNSPIHQIIHYLKTDGADHSGITLSTALGGLYLLAVLLGGSFLARASIGLRKIYIVALSGLAFTMMFITPNLGAWNLELFLQMNAHVPFFGMFRNMFDKFGVPMSFHYALALFAALTVIGEAKWRSIYKYLLVGVLSMLLVSTSWQYIKPDYQDSAYSTRISGEMNEDFIALTDYIKNLDTTSRFVWLPMTFPGHIYIGDQQNPNHFYVGLSPLQFLAQKSDLVGFWVMRTPTEPDLNWKTLELLREGSYEQVATILGQQNIGYIIVNHETVPAEGMAFLNGFNFMGLQTEEFFAEMLGEKIADFGSRYSLYTINEKYYLPTVSGATAFKKFPDGSYEVTVSEEELPTQLVLLEPYDPLWKIEGVSTPSSMIYRYGNAWEIDKAGTYTIDFWPRRVTWPAFGFSVAAFVAALGYVGFMLVRSNRR